MLADDHAIVRRGLRSLLETDPQVTVVGEAGDGMEAIRLSETHAPDVEILDIGLPMLNGIEVASRLRAHDKPPRVVILSLPTDESYILRALAAHRFGLV